MTTPWYQKALEAIGFDIILIGALFILTVFIVQELGKPESPFLAFYRGWQRFCEYFGLNTQANADSTSVLATVKAVGSGMAVLLLAAGAGMTLDAFAHRVLDVKPSLPESRPGLELADQHTANAPPEFRSCDGSCFLQEIKFAWPQDEIKREAFDATAATWTNTWHPKLKIFLKDEQDPAESPATCRGPRELFLNSYADAKSSDTAEKFQKLCANDQKHVLEFLQRLAKLRKLEERQAKELYQQAHLRILDSGKTEIKTDLSRDELVAKLFRVMFVLTVILFLAALLTIKAGGKGQIGARAAMAGLLVGIGLVFIYSWSQQSRHYYKKVYHAYSIIEPDRTAFVPLSPSPITNDFNYYPNPKDATAILKAIAKLQELAKDDADWKSALQSKNGDRLLSFDFYNCLLTACTRYSDKALVLTDKQKQAWLRYWRASLQDAGFVDGRTVAILSGAENFSIPNSSSPGPAKAGSQP